MSGTKEVRQGLGNNIRIASKLEKGGLVRLSVLFINEQPTPLQSELSIFSIKNISSNMASRMIALRTVARSQTLWARPVSTSAVRAADKDDKSMYDKVKDKAGVVQSFNSSRLRGSWEQTRWRGTVPPAC